MFRRPIPADFRITFRRDVLAEALWEYGEAELAEAALGLGERDLHQVQLLAVWHTRTTHTRQPAEAHQRPCHGPRHDRVGGAQ